MTTCSPEAGNTDRGRSPMAILPAEGKQIIMLPSHKAINIIKHSIAGHKDDTTNGIAIRKLFCSLCLFVYLLCLVRICREKKKKKIPVMFIVVATIPVTC